MSDQSVQRVTIQNQPVQQQPSGPASILEVIDRAARDQSVDVSKLEKLFALAEQIRARQAKTEFDASMASAQGEMQSISRDCYNPQTRGHYASYEAIDTAIRPIYTTHGFAMSFGSKAASAADRVIVTCRVSHRAGHTETVELDMPADGKGARGNDVMSKTHATGSALSYAKRYITNLVWNLSFGEADDDGNSSSRRTEPEPQQRQPASSAPRGFTGGNMSASSGGTSPQQMLKQSVESAGFDWARFSIWAEGSGQQPDGVKWGSWDDIPTPDAVRIYRSRDGMNKQLAMINLDNLKAA